MLNKQKQNSFKSPYLIPILRQTCLALSPFTMHLLCASKLIMCAFHVLSIQQLIFISPLLHDGARHWTCSSTCFINRVLSQSKILATDSPAIVSSFTANKQCHTPFQIFHSYAFIHAIHLLRLDFPHSPRCV